MKTHTKESLKNLYEDILTENERKRVAKKLNCTIETLYEQDNAELYYQLQQIMIGG